MSEVKAAKHLGQHFLRDEAVIARLLAVINAKAGERILEIGPGLGAITEPLAAKLHCLHVCEIDRDIIGYLKTRPYAGKLVIHEGDVLQFDFAGVPGRKKIVGNLPYNISTPLLFHLSRYAGEVEDMHFMLQKEVVERMVAEPGSNDFGRLSVMLQYFFEMEKLLDVPPEAFSPAPKVDSAVVRLIPAKHRIGQAQDFGQFAALVKQAFHQRRKTIRNNLKGLADDDDLQAAGISPQERAEHIAPEKYVALANLLAQKAS